MERIHRSSLNRLKVMRFATMATPFPPSTPRGLAEYEGKVAAALSNLKIDVYHILPLFRQTREAIDHEGQTKKLKLQLSCDIDIDGKKYPTKIYSLQPNANYLLCFVEQDYLFNRDNPFSQNDDQIRFCYLSLSAFQMARSNNFIPDIFLGADWQGAQAIYHLKFSPENSDGFFQNTKSVLGVHAFQYPGTFVPSTSALEMGVQLADRGYIMRSKYLAEITEKGSSPSANMIRARISEHKLIPFPKDDLWDPENKTQPSLSDESAMRFARLELGIFRSLVERDFGDAMEQALKADETMAYVVQTPKEKLQAVNPNIVPYYDKLSQEDRDRVDTEILQGHEKRFQHVNTERDFLSIVEFIKIKPSCDFEKRMRQEGLDFFIDGYNPDPDKKDPLFFPGDLNRLMSVALDLSQSEHEELRQAKTLSINDALRKSKIRGHVINVLASMRRIAAAQELAPSELSKILSERGDPKEVGAGGLKSEIQIFTQLSAVFRQISKDKGRFRVLVLAAILHDMGKFIKNETHPREGVRLLKEIEPLRVLLGELDYNLLRSLVLHHSTVGDSVMISDANPIKIEDMFKLYTIEENRYLFLNCLHLLGVVDADGAHGDRGMLTPKKIQKLSNAFWAAINASNINDLKKNMAIVGISPERWGNALWNILITVGTKSEKAQREYLRQATAELVKYGRSLKKSNYKILFKIRLGRLISNFHLTDLMQKIENPRLRARLLFRLLMVAEFYQHWEFKFDIKDKDLPTFIDLLEKEDITFSDLDVVYDPDSNLLKVSLFETKSTGDKAKSG